MSMHWDSSGLEDVLARRLSRFASLSDEEAAALRVEALGQLRRSEARRDLIREGEHPRAVFLIASGWACRYKTLEDGRRQIVAFLIPGDLCDLNNFILGEMDHTISAVTAVRYVEVSHDLLERLTDAHPRIARALWSQLLASLSVQREWVLNLGQRNAIERIGHLFCELFVRLKAVGLAHGDSFELPITQLDIAEATGLTSVHVNRTLQEMRAQKLITLSNRTLHIPDFTRLRDVSLFNPAYLHLGHDGKHAPSKQGIGVVTPP